MDISISSTTYQRRENYSFDTGTGSDYKGGLLRDVWVYILSIEYILYVSLQSFMTWGQSVEE